MSAYLQRTRALAAAALLAFAVCFGLAFATQAYAESGGGGDTQQLAPAQGLQAQAGEWSGAGTEADPYVISDAAGLQKLANEVNSSTGIKYNGEHFKLGADIDLNNVEWTPIGYTNANGGGSTTTASVFAGTFDGDGHTIKNLKISTPKATGNGTCASYALFGNARGTFKNFVVQGDITIGSDYTQNWLMVAGVVGFGYNANTFENVGNEVNITQASSSNNTYVGGIMARTASFYTMTACYNKGNIASSLGLVGGLVGQYSSSNEATYTACYNAGDIALTSNTTVGTTSNAIGGLMGTTGSYSRPFKGCFNYGEVSYVYGASLTDGSDQAGIGAIVGSETMSNSSSAAVYFLEYKLVRKATNGTSKTVDDHAAGRQNSAYGSWPTFDNASAINAAAFKSADVLTELNKAASAVNPEKGAFKVGADYPVLYWEASGAPIITAQPQGYDVQQNAVATALAVEASLPAEGETGSDGALSYQWFKAEGDEAIEGANQASYMPDVSALGATDYYCVVTNTFTVDSEQMTASATSDPAKVNVQDANDASTPVVAMTLAETAGQADKVEAEVAVNGLTYTDGEVAYKLEQAGKDAVEGTAKVDAEAGTASFKVSVDTYSLGANEVKITVTNTYQLTKTAEGSDTKTITISGKTVGTADELADFAAQVNAGDNFANRTVTLTADIDMSTLSDGKTFVPIGNNTTKFAGEIAGADHKIANLSISGATYGALVGYADGAYIHNLEVDGAITGVDFAAGIVAYANNVTVENVANHAAITQDTGSNYSSGAGGIFGYATTGSKVSKSYNDGAITGKARVGGIAGYGNAVIVTDCYNLGTVTNTGAADQYNNGTAGIIGNTGSNSYGDPTVIITNAYNAGAIVPPAGATRSYGSVAYAQVASDSATYPTCTNVFYLEGTSDVSVGRNLSGNYDATATYAATVKPLTTSTLPTAFTTLGANWQQAPANYHDGYPALSWETVPEASLVTFVLASPVDNLKLSLAIGDKVVAPAAQADGTYTALLPEGAYSYTAEAFGYVTQTVEFVVTSEPATVQIPAFEEAVKQQVAFTATSGGEVVEGYNISLASAEGIEIAPNEDGSFAVPAAKDYAYSVGARGYTSVEGTFSVEEISEEAVSVSVELTKLDDEWDGEHSYAPLVDEAGVYQIGDAYELAWLAEQVNSGVLAAPVNAVQTADISLNDKDWTPIGAAASPFVGSFDGQGFAVTGLYFKVTSDNDYAGLFGNVGNADMSTTLKGLHVSGTIDSNNPTGWSGTVYKPQVGAVAAAITNTTVSECGSDAELIKLYDGMKGAGGIVGLVKSGGTSKIEKCAFSGMLASSRSNYGEVFGGVVGKVEAAGTIIDSCYAACTFGDYYSQTGGIIGIASANTTVSNSYAAVVFSVNKTAGNIAGSSSSLTFRNCYYFVPEGSQRSQSVGNTATLENITKVDSLADITADKLGRAFKNDRVFVEGAALLSWESLSDKIALNDPSLALSIGETSYNTDPVINATYNDYSFTIDAKQAAATYYADEACIAPIVVSPLPKGTTYAKLAATELGDFTGESNVIEFEIVNDAPTLAEGVEAEEAASQFSGLEWSVDLSTVFVDANGDALTYTVAKDDAAPEATEEVFSFEMPEEGSFTFEFVANDGTVDSTSSYKVTLGVREETVATVDYTAQAAGAFLAAPQFGAEVPNRLAEDYGYSDEVEGVSALDVLVAANISVFGEEDFAADPAEYLIVSTTQYGASISKIFGIETYNASFAINGEAPYDAEHETYPAGNGMPESYYGLGFTQAEVQTGDFCEFFVYQSNYALDYYAWFVSDDERVDAVDAVAGEELNLSVRGYWYGWYSLAVPESFRDGSALDAEGLPIIMVDAETGAATPFDPAVAVDEDGECVVTFTEPGTYLLAIQGDEYTDIVSSIVKVNVSARPQLAEGVESEVAAKQFAGLDYTVDLATIFADADSDELTYTVAVNGEDPVTADELFGFATPAEGTTTLEFAASDGVLTSTETYSVTLTQREETAATVDYTAQAAGAFLAAPQFGAEVPNRLAEEYGYIDEVEGVSALDVLVAANISVFGEEDFAADPAEFLIVSMTQYGTSISKIFGIETYSTSFAINGAAPYDPEHETWPASDYGPESYNGLNVGNAGVETGDFCEFFVYQDEEYAMDYYAWFADDAGRVDSLDIIAGESVSLNIKGYMYGWYGLAVQDSYNNGEALPVSGMAEGLPVVMIDAKTGAAVPFDPEVAADEDGAFTATFAEPGTYILAIQSDEDLPIISSIAKINVKAVEVAKDELREAIAAAQALMDDVDAISEDGADVTTDKVWNTQENTDALQAVIEAAQAVIDDDSATGNDVADMASALAQAVASYEAGIADGTRPLATDEQKAAAETLIYNAERALDGVYKSEDGSGLEDGDKWAPSDKIDAVLKAIANLDDTLETEDSLPADVLDDAAATLVEAIDSFKAAVKNAPLAKYNQLNGTVYASVSYDGKFVTADAEGANDLMAMIPVDLEDVSAIDLDDYGYGDFKHAATDENADYQYETSALQLVIYLHENYKSGGAADSLAGYDSDPEGQYGIPHTFGITKFWGRDTSNLTYTLNAESTGTVDTVYLDDGDVIDFTVYAGSIYDVSWNPDANAGSLNFYEDSNAAYTDIAMDYVATAGEEATLNVRKVASTWVQQDGGEWVQQVVASGVEGLEVNYGVEYGTSLGTATADSNGDVKMTFADDGEYLVWVDGIKGASVDYAVTNPACAKVYVGAAPATEEALKQLARDVRNAERLLNSVASSADGSDVTDEEQWASDEAVEAFEGAIDNAKILVGDDEASAAEVAEAMSNLADAKAAFETEIKAGAKASDSTKSDLAIAAAAAAASDVSSASDEAKAALQEAIEEAQALASGSDVTVEQVAEAQSKLENALESALGEQATASDKAKAAEELAKAVEEAKAANVADASDEAKAALAQAIQDAEAAAANADATAADLAAAKSALDQALGRAADEQAAADKAKADAYAEQVKAAADALKQAAEDAEAMSVPDASQSAKDLLADAIAAANAVADDPNATLAQIASAKALLTQAAKTAADEQAAAEAASGGQASDEAKAAEELAKAVEEAKAANVADASDEAKAALAQAIQDAEAAAANADATAADLAAAKSALDQALGRAADEQAAADKAKAAASNNGLPVGSAFTVKNKVGTWTYKVTAAKQVMLTKATKTKNKGKATINTVAYQGVTYSVTAIGPKALKSSKLASVTVGDNVTSIGKQAFQKSKKLKKMTVGKNVASIGAKAFAGAKKLKKITVKSAKLTSPKAVKGALKGSKVKTVKLSGVKGAAKKQAKKAFKKAGKKGVKVK